MGVSKIEWFYVSKETKGQSLNNFIQFSMQYIANIRSSRSKMFFKIVVLKVCNIHRKTPVWSLFLIKFIKNFNFIKKRLQHIHFSLKNTTGDCFCTFIWWSVGRQNRNNIVWFLESVFFENYFAQQAQKKNPQLIVYYNNDKCFLVWVIYISLLCFISYLQKGENNRLKKV